jgi:hypothetical protein
MFKTFNISKLFYIIIYIILNKKYVIKNVIININIKV